MKSPRDIVDRMKSRRDLRPPADSYPRETFTLPLDAARAKAREILDRYPTVRYATIVEQWRQLDDGKIEFYNAAISNGELRTLRLAERLVDGDCLDAAATPIGVKSKARKADVEPQHHRTHGDEQSNPAEDQYSR